MLQIIKNYRHMKTKILILFVIFLSIANATVQDIKSYSFNADIYSEILKSNVSYTIYLAQGYSSSDKNFPVLYLLHGCENNMGWIDKGGINRIADEMISHGSISPMILIIPEDAKRSWYI